MLNSIIISLILTIVIEVTLSLIIGLRDTDNIEKVILVNILTNPLVVTTTNIVYLLSQSYIFRNIVLGFLEVAVIFVEGFLFKKLLKDFKINSYLFALYLNGISFLLGIIINHFILV